MIRLYIYMQHIHYIITFYPGLLNMEFYCIFVILAARYTLSEAWSGVNWADVMAAQGAFGTDFYDRSTRMIVGTMLWTEYSSVIKIGPKCALGSHEIRPIHSTPSLGQSIVVKYRYTVNGTLGFSRRNLRLRITTYSM